MYSRPHPTPAAAASVSWPFFLNTHRARYPLAVQGSFWGKARIFSIPSPPVWTRPPNHYESPSLPDSSLHRKLPHSGKSILVHCPYHYPFLVIKIEFDVML